MPNWKGTLLALSLAALAAAPLAAAEQTTGPAPDDNAAAAARAKGDVREAIEDAVAALEETEAAIKALKEKDDAAAAAALERAIGKLEVVLAREPDLVLAPVDVRATVIDTPASPRAIRRARREAARLLDSGRLQLARPIISTLASEVDIDTTYLPLGAYPLALKSAAALIKDDKRDDAVAVLANAIDMLVIKRTVVPLPLLKAESLIAEAKTISEKADRSDDENIRLGVLLDAIDAQIAKGEALEYGGPGAFDAIKDEMKEIRRKTSDGGFGEGFFARLQKLFSSLGEDAAEQAAGR